MNRGLLAAALAMMTLCAHAETTECTVVSPPAVISAPGVYCLTRDHALSLASGDAILVNASNVLLDFNSHYITNIPAGAGNTATGVRVRSSTGSPLRNVRVQNGTLRGFQSGMDYASSDSGIIEGMLVDRSLMVGIGIGGYGNVVRGNRVVGTGKEATLRFATGISVSGDGFKIENNYVMNTMSEEPTGIAVYPSPSPKSSYGGSDGGVVSGNIVSDFSRGLGQPSVRARGIYVYPELTTTPNAVLVRHNTVLDTAQSNDAISPVGISAENVTIYDNVVRVSGVKYDGSWRQDMENPWNKVRGTTNY